MKTGTIKDKSLGILLSLALCLSLAAPIAMPGAVKANVSNISVNPYDSNFIGTSTEYQITMTAGTVLDSGKTITIKFPSDTSMPADGDDASHYLVDGTVCTVNAGVSGKELTVTVPNIVINADTSFIVTITSAAGMANPTDSSQSGADLYKAEVKTSAEPTYAPSAAYTIVGVDVYTGGTVYSDSYTTITAAIAAATDGDTITVPDKTFSEAGPIAVAKQLSFTGKRADGTTDSWDVGTAGANASCPTIELAGDPAAPILNITGTDVVLRGFEIDSTGNEWTGMNIGGTDGLLVQYCTFAADEYDSAISIFDNPATDFTIDYCSFSGTGATHWFTIDEGGGCSADTLSTNLLSINSIDGLVSRLYMYSEDIHDVTYYHNQFTNAADGIQLRRLWWGYTGGTYDDIVVDQNTFDGGANETFAFGSMTVYEQIQDSWFEGGSYDGTQVVLSHNSFGKFTGTRTTMETVCWDIQGGSPADLTATGNYWGNASGPTHTDSTIGAVTYGADVSADVNFRPWLIEEYTGQDTSSHITIQTDGTLPDGQVGNAYSETFTATQGSGGGYTWAKYDAGGESWPAGNPAFAMSTGGVFSGTPTTYKDSADPYQFGIWVKDDEQGTYAAFDLSVYASGFYIATTSLPDGNAGAAYSQTLQVSGGTGTNTWSVVSGALPTGLDSINGSTGEISGTPSAAGTFNFTVKVASGNQSAQRAFSIDISTFSAPTLVSPADDASAPGTWVTFEWEAVQGATTYWLLVDKAAEWSSPWFFYEEVGSDLSCTVTGFPNDGTKFRWRVWGVNAGGYGPGSRIWDFTNTAAPPPSSPPTSAPTLVSPADDASAPGTWVTFEWEAVQGATTYWLLVDKAAEWSSPWFFYEEVGTDLSSIVTDFPNDGTEFRWRVWGVNAAGYGPGPRIWDFTNTAAPPPAPSLLCPGASVTFKWSGSSGATRYWLQVNTDSDFSGTDKLDEEVGSVTSREVTGLTIGTTYYWRVKAGNDDGWGDWSSTGSVIANEVP